jgi:hypothetical protein
MPDHIYAVPGNVVATSDRLAVGRVAATLLSDRGLPVAVSAVDGRYHVLRLPGFLGASLASDPVSLAVSPDGRQLAYTWQGALPERSGAHVPSGIRVVDTATGRIRSYPVPGGVGATCGALSWSENALYLVSLCTIDNTLDQHGDSGVENIERLSMVDGSVGEVPMPYQDGGLAVANNGDVADASGDTIYFWSNASSLHSAPVPHQFQVTLPHGAAPATSVQIENSQVATGSVTVVAGSSILRGRPGITSGAFGLRHWTTLARAGVQGNDAVILGEVRPGVTAVMISEPGGNHVVTFGPSGSRVSRVEVDGSPHLSDYSFATALLQSPTRSTPKPDWPIDWRSYTTPFIVALVLLAGLGLVFVRLFRARRKRAGQ